MIGFIRFTKILSSHSILARGRQVAAGNFGSGSKRTRGSNFCQVEIKCLGYIKQWLFSCNPAKYRLKLLRGKVYFAMARGLVQVLWCDYIAVAFTLTLLNNCARFYLSNQYHVLECTSVKEWFTHKLKFCHLLFPHVVPNLHDFLSVTEHKRRRLEECSRCSFPYSEIEWGLGAVELLKAHTTCVLLYSNPSEVIDQSKE